MNFKIETIPTFDRQAKRLAKKYPSLRQDLSNLIIQLAQQPNRGTALGNNFFKIRLAVSSKGKGKSGGARVITFVKVSKSTVYLASIFDKSEKSTLSDQELKHIFALIPK
jgi:hypothetical protein